MSVKLMIVLGGLLFISVSHGQEHVVGIGIDLGIRRLNRMEVIHVFPNTPASRAGIVPGVLVQKIDGVATEGKSLGDCAKMIRGAVGSKVTLELVDTHQRKTNTVELIRSEIQR